MQSQIRIHQVKAWWREDWDVISPKADCIFGHVPFGIIEQNMKLKDPTRIIFLRDPVERVISLYYHIQNKITHPQYPFFQHYSLDSLIDKQIYASFDNDMCRFISGRQHSHFCPPGNPVTEMELEIAKECLDQYDEVGFVETFDKDFKRIQDRFGWKGKYKIQLVGDRPARSELLWSTVDKIYQITHYDKQLYEYAKEKYA